MARSYDVSSLDETETCTILNWNYYNPEKILDSRQETRPPTNILHASRPALLVLGITCLLCLIGRGTLESYAIFLVALEQDLGWSRTSASAIYSASLIVYGFSGPIVGWLIDRYGPERVYAACLLVAAAGLALNSRAESWGVFMVSQGGIVGFGVAGISWVSMTVMISRWFKRLTQQAMAVGHAVSGAGVLVYSPLSEHLIAVAGWRGAYLVLAGIALGASALAAVLFRMRVGEGNPVHHQGETGTTKDEVGLSVPEALKTAGFWGICWVYLMTGIASYTIILQTPSLLVSLGHDLEFAAIVQGANGFLATIGMIAISQIVPRFGQTRIILISYGCSILGTLSLLIYANTLALPWLLGFVGFFGFTVGCRSPALASIGASLYQGAAFGRIYGIITIAGGCGMALGGFSGGLLYELTGGYQAGLLWAVGAFALGNIPFWAVPSMRQ